MFITKKHLQRRTFLKGAGATLALPLLEAMIPAGTALAQTAANVKPRFMGIFYPHGMAPGYWVPENVGTLGTLPPILEPLEKVKAQTVILSGLWSKSAEPPEGTTGSDHWVAAAFLTAFKPRKTAGSDANVGSATIDQVIAQKIGQESLLPSLQLAVEDPGANSSNCGEGYSCSYTNSISWTSATSPLPMELNPQVVFERLFGSGSTAEERAARRELGQSILDSLVGELARLKSRVGAGDRTTIDQYSTEVREIERRLQLAAGASTAVPSAGSPSGVPDNFDDHIKLQMDLTALAFQADITRVATLLGARDLTSRSYKLPDGTNSGAFHGLSHHAESPKTIKQFSGLNRYHVGTMAYLAEKLKSIREGDGTLLDHSLVLYGTNMGNSNQHNHFDVPHILVGGLNGRLKGARHLAYPTKTITTGNLLLSLMDLYDIHQDVQGDSTGRLEAL
ncbi:MAG TPA: DUF1552 domain-containing protein [Terriglobia bacterium]|nr:DUF1552 domain-containing protein [Terriglobia bacterium]